MKHVHYPAKNFSYLVYVHERQNDIGIFIYKCLPITLNFEIFSPHFIGLLNDINIKHLL